MGVNMDSIISDTGGGQSLVDAGLAEKMDETGEGYKEFHYFLKPVNHQ